MDSPSHAISFDYTSVRDLDFDRIPKLLQKLIVDDLEKTPCPCVVLVYSESTWCRVYLQTSPGNAEDQQPQDPVSENERQMSRFTMDLNGVSLDFGVESVTLILSTESSHCPFCDSQMPGPPNESDWSTHIANHIELRYCSECGDRVTGEPSTHEHQSRKPAIKPRPNINDISEQKNEDPLFVCHYCQAFFPTRMALGEHVSSHNILQRYMCENCGHQFSTVGSLNRHRRQQHRSRNDGSEKPLMRCQTCNQNITRCLRQYILHVSRFHKTQKRLCHICGRSFPLIGRVKRHVQEVHCSTPESLSPTSSHSDAMVTAGAPSTIFVLSSEGNAASTVYSTSAVYVHVDANTTPGLLPSTIISDNEVDLELSAGISEGGPLCCSDGVESDLSEATGHVALPPVSSGNNFDESSNCSFSSTLLASPSKYLATFRSQPDFAAGLQTQSQSQPIGSRYQQ